MSLSKQILIGLLAGVAVGLFFGERVSFLELPAQGFIQLIQVTVLPFVVGSLIAGIGGGTPAQARRLAAHGGLVIAVLWAMSLALVFLSPLALSPDKGGSFFASAEITNTAEIDWLDLYIPSNPFRALANNVVPAVVVFSVLLGIAVLGMPGKERILEPLRAANDALGRAGSLLVRLTPLGLFAMAGHAAGTLRLEEFERLQAFLHLHTWLCVILALWLLPGLVSTLTGLPYRRILQLALDPLLTALVTANLFIVLPLLASRSKTLLAEAGIPKEDADEAVDVLVPASFTFPHSAKLLSLIFVLFAGWFVGAPVPATQYPMLAGAGVLSFFGSLNTAMPFLLDLVRLPADLFQLFVVSSVLNSRVGSAAAAMHTFALALLASHLMTGRVRFERKRVVRYAVVSVVLVATFLVGSRLLLFLVLPGPETASAALDRLRVTGAWGRLAPVPLPSAVPESAAPVPGMRLEEILRRGSLRFGVTTDEVPWSFRNTRGEAVGFEADIAHAVALGLEVSLELVTVPRLGRAGALASGACDLAMGRVTPDGARRMLFSAPVTHESWAFLVPDHERDLFASLERARQRRSLRVALLDVPEWAARLQSLLPEAEIETVDTILTFLNAPPGRYHATYTGYARGTAYSLLYPRFSAVVPKPDMGTVPIVFTVPPGEESLVDFVNAWLDHEQASGLVEAKLAYWIRGQGAQLERRPRWSFGRDVLGWWKE